MMSKAEVEAAMAAATGLSSGEVSKFFDALAQVAYSEGRNGFLLPGFGRFIVKRGEPTEAINPFTGQPAMMKGRWELNFEADTAAHEQFLSAEGPTLKLHSEPSKPAVPLPTLRLIGTDAELGSDNLSGAFECGQLGGEPDWIQCPETPVCCAVPMAFYAQVDSRHLPHEFNLVDAGSIYIFFCESCFKVRAPLQFY